MNKKIALVQTYCDSQEKLDYLSNNIDKLKDLNIDVIIFSYIDIPHEIIEKADFYIFSKCNPVLWEEKRGVMWYENNQFKLESQRPDYGWSILNQIKSQYELIKNMGYEQYFIVNYDLIINDDVISCLLRNEEISIFSHEKGDIVIPCCLIFASFNDHYINKIIQLIEKQDYINNSSLFAEYYFHEKIKLISDTQPNENIILKDFFDIATKETVLNLSKNNNYKIFIDNNNLLKFYFEKINKKTDFKILINEHIINPDNNLLYEQNINDIKLFGCINDGKFDNWLPLIYDKFMINTITIKN